MKVQSDWREGLRYWVAVADQQLQRSTCRSQEAFRTGEYEQAAMDLRETLLCRQYTHKRITTRLAQGRHGSRIAASSLCA